MNVSFPSGKLRQTGEGGLFMGIHSKILVHWTGKIDFEDKGFPNDVKATRYVERLRDYYQNGLYLKTTEESTLRGRKIKRLFRICFTEIRLSQAQTHSDRYGNLGIGFTRDFIMNKGGRPVIYIPFEADKRLMEDSLDKAYETSADNEEVHGELLWLQAHVKRMSDGVRDDGYYENYEEMEWRLVYRKGYNHEDFTEVDEHVCRLKFTAGDVKIIIFPNEETQRMALSDKSIKEFFSQHTPSMVTVEDCSDF